MAHVITEILCKTTNLAGKSIQYNLRRISFTEAKVIRGNYCTNTYHQVLLIRLKQVGDRVNRGGTVHGVVLHQHGQPQVRVLVKSDLKDRRYKHMLFYSNTLNI